MYSLWWFKAYKEGCFKIVGYPEWWDDLQKRRAATKAPASRTGGKAHLTAADQPDTSCSKSGKEGDWYKGEELIGATEGMDNNGENQKEEEERESPVVWEGEGNGIKPKTLIYKHITLTPIRKPLSPSPNFYNHNIVNTHLEPEIPTSLLSHKRNSQWIFDCGATDIMTFDPCYFLSFHPSNRTHIQTANGEFVPVDQAGPVNISPFLHLKNCLFIPSLSHKLFSVSHLTKDLNCIVFFNPNH